MSSELRTELIPAAGQIVVADLANFLMLIQTASAVTVRLEGESGNYSAANVEAGYVKGNVRPWNRATIVGVAGSTVRFLIGFEDINEDFTDYRRTVGVFQAQQPATIADADDVDVGGVAGPVQVAPANAARRKITFTNLDTSVANVRIGAAATVAAGRGQRLTPGQSYTTEVTGAHSAIRESAAAALVSVSEEVY